MPPRGRAARGVPDGNRNVAISAHVPFRAAALVGLVGIGRMRAGPTILTRMLDQARILHSAVSTVPTCCAVAVDVGVWFGQALPRVGAYVLSANRALCVCSQSSIVTLPVARVSEKPPVRRPSVHSSAGKRAVRDACLVV